MGGTDLAPAVGGMTAAGIVFVIYFAIIGVSLLMGLAVYILNSIGLMTIAKNRGITHPWMAWIPYASVYLFGKLSDDINFCKGKRTNHRKLLLGMLIGFEASFFVGYLMVLLPPLLAGLVQAGNDISYYAGGGVMADSSDLPIWAIIVMLVGLAIMLVCMILAVVYSVFYYIALYNILNAYAPNMAVVILLLTILVFSPLSSIYLFAIRNRAPAEPMYPTQPQPPVQTGYQPTPPVQPQAPVQSNTQPTSPTQPQAPVQSEGYRIYPPQEPTAPQPNAIPQADVSRPTEVLSQPTEVLSQPTEVLSDYEEN